MFGWFTSITPMLESSASLSSPVKLNGFVSLSTKPRKLRSRMEEEHARREGIKEKSYYTK